MHVLTHTPLYVYTCIDIVRFWVRRTWWRNGKHEEQPSPKGTNSQKLLQRHTSVAFVCVILDLFLQNGSVEKLHSNIYCRAIQALQNGTWIVGIGSNLRHFLARWLFVRAKCMQRNGYLRAHGCLWVIKHKLITVEELFLPAGLRLESWK